MENENDRKDTQHLPDSVVDLIGRIISKMRYRKKVRQEVRAELIAHFEDELRDCTTDREKEQKARQAIADFGDIKLLAILLRRAKKRCRPRWKTALVRTFQALALLLLCFILYAVWFSTGKPTISVDYTALLNRMNLPELRDKDNAWPHYQKAVSLYVEPNDDETRTLAYQKTSKDRRCNFADLTAEEQTGITGWVMLNEPAWRAFETGSSRSYCYRAYTHDPNDEEKWLMAILLPNLADIRNIARLGIWRSRIASEKGNIPEALDACIVVARAGSHRQGKGPLVEQLVGLAMCRLADKQIAVILDAHDIPADRLDHFRQQLSRIYPDEYTLVDTAGERLAFMDTVQHVFTRGGLGGGHLIPGQWLWLVDDFGTTIEQDKEAKRFMLPILAAASMAHARRDRTVKKANELYDRQEQFAKMTPYQRRAADIESADDMLQSLPHYRFYLLYYLFPAVDRITEFGYRGRVSHQATLTILALKRWRAERGEYPPGLGGLVTAGFLKEMPMDPYSDKPLVYSKTGDDFMLYTVGPDFTDDAGRPGRDKRGRPKDWTDNGDTLFWPVLQDPSQPGVTSEK